MIIILYVKYQGPCASTRPNCHVFCVICSTIRPTPAKIPRQFTQVLVLKYVQYCEQNHDQGSVRSGPLGRSRSTTARPVWPGAAAGPDGRDEQLASVELHDRKAREWVEKLEQWAVGAEADLHRQSKLAASARKCSNTVRPSSLLNDSTGCASAGMRCQNDGVSRYCASRAEHCLALGEVEECREGIHPRAVTLISFVRLILIRRFWRFGRRLRQSSSRAARRDEVRAVKLSIPPPRS